MVICFDAICTGGQSGLGWSIPTQYGEEGWHEGAAKTTIRAENEVEAQRVANNYKVGRFNLMQKFNTVEKLFYYFIC